jgi:hypothetical protein
MSAKPAAAAPISIPGIPDDFFVVKASGLSQAQALTAYLGGSAFQTIMDNPITAYRYVCDTCGGDRRREGAFMADLSS